jgi:hypothetical protein
MLKETKDFSMQNYSQLFQDIFAISTAKNKTYIEIGAWNPEKYNNTYLLELNGWKGFSVEIDKLSKKSLWDDHQKRNNTIYWENAITFDYSKALNENKLGNRIGYLSVDIEPPQNTFAALQRVIEQGITADCITFEHDKYYSDIDYDPIVTEYLKNKDYSVAVKDVYRHRKYRVDGQKKKSSSKCFMETWYVHNSLKINEQTYNEWLIKNIK